MSERLKISIDKNVKNFTKNDERKIRNELNLKNINSVIKYARDAGVNLGKRRDTQKRRALDYARDIYNDRIEITNQNIIDARKERKKEQRIIRSVVSKTTLDAMNGFENVRYRTRTKNLNQLYKSVKYQQNKLGDETYLTLYFKNKTNGVISHRTIKSDFLSSYEDLLDRVEEIKLGGGPAGSGPLPDDEFEIIMNVYDLLIEKIFGNSNSEYMLFKTKNIDGGKYKNCYKQVLDIIDPKNKHNNKELSDFNNFKDALLPLNVNFIANTFQSKKGVNNFLIKKNSERVKIKYTNKDVVCIKPQIKNYELHYFIKKENPDYTVIYDSTKKHYDIIDGDIQFDENVYLSLNNRVFKNVGTKTDRFIQISTANNLNKVANSNPKTNHYYFFWDIETITDFDDFRCMKPYSVSFTIANDHDLKELDKIDKNKNKKDLLRWKDGKVFSFVGYDAIDMMVDFIVKGHCKYRGQGNNIFSLVSFNGSSFDNFFLLDNILKTNRSDVWVKDIFYNDSQLLKFVINGKDTIFDLRKHLVGNLKQNCKSFQVSELCEKLEFNHYEAQKLHERGELIEFMSGNQKLKEYNENDTISLAVIFERYKQSLENMDATSEASKNLTNSFGEKNAKTFSTIGSLSMNCFNKNIEELNKKMKIEFPKLDIDKYDDILKYKCAGRVEMFNGVQKVNEEVSSLDICSMYPFIMAIKNGSYFPHGELKETDVFVEDKIGFYYCDIDQSILWEGFKDDIELNLNELQYDNLKKGNLPNIYPEKVFIESKRTGDFLGLKENDYSSKKILKDYLISSVMIKQLKKYNCKVDIKKGFYFTEKIKGCDLFKFLLEFMKGKNQQDGYKRNKDRQYNACLRETYKLLSNSISGKMIEKLHLSKTELLDQYQYLSLKDNVGEFEDGNKVKKINEINVIGGKTFITYEYHEEVKIKTQRPIYIGVLIYDYSKEYIYNTAYSIFGKDKLLYTDTDSCKVRKSDLTSDKIKQYYKDTKVDVWDDVYKYDEKFKNHKLYDSKSKVYGSYEDEFEGDNIYKFYCFQKKSWVALGDSNHISFKGVPTTSLIIDINHDWIDKKINKKNEIEISIKDYRKANDYYECNKNLEVIKNLELFTNKLYNEKYCYVLSYNFKKVVKSNVNDLTLNNQVVLQPIIKKIKI